MSWPSEYIKNMAGNLHLIVAPAAEDNLWELESRPTMLQRHKHDQILAAFEAAHHAYFLGVCKLPGVAGEKMIRLRKWRSEHIGNWQALATFLLCKKPFIAVGRLGVSSSSSIMIRSMRVGLMQW